MIVKYVNSNNDHLSFFDKDMKIHNGTFHQRKWTIENDKAFKNAISYKMTITLRGNLEEKKAKLNEIFELFEYDLENNVKGTLYVDDYHIPCNVVSSEEKINCTNNHWIDLDIEFYCESANWIKETTYSLDDVSQEKLIINAKQYKYRYPYIYNSNKDVVNITNGSVSKSDVIIRIFGACRNPYVKIGNVIYKVNISLENDEYVEINTEDRTITKISKFGDKSNVFMYRDTSRSDFFTKIDKGVLMASKGGEYRAEITVIEKRSEPKWI